MASCVSSGSGRWGLSAVRGLSSGRSVRRWVVLVSHPSNEASLSVFCICGICDFRAEPSTLIYCSFFNLSLRIFLDVFLILGSSLCRFGVLFFKSISGLFVHFFLPHCEHYLWAQEAQQIETLCVCVCSCPHTTRACYLIVLLSINRSGSDQSRSCVSLE